MTFGPCFVGLGAYRVGSGLVKVVCEEFSLRSLFKRRLIRLPLCEWLVYGIVVEGKRSFDLIWKNWFQKHRVGYVFGIAKIPMRGGGCA